MPSGNHRRVAMCLIAILLLPPAAWGGEHTPTAEAATEEAVQPKFVWGLLLNLALKFAMDAFGDWLKPHLSLNLRAKPVLDQLQINSKQARIVPLTSVSPTSNTAAGAPENTIIGNPEKPLKVDGGVENYQAVHIAIVGFDRDGIVTGLRPVSEGFRNGDRFKLKILPTFDGILVIENITPSGQRRQIFPPAADAVVAVKRGIEILTPMAEDQYFEFTGAMGEEQLVITLRDPRAFGDAAAAAEAQRKDDQYGSSLMQETTPGKYPVIAQSLKLRHGL